METTTTNTEYASKGVAGSGLGLGIAGTALGLLNGGMGLMGNRSSSVTQEQMTDQQTISSLQSQLALAQAKYDNETNENTKLVEVYKALAARDKEVEGRIMALETGHARDLAAFEAYKASQAEIQRLRDENMKLYIDNKIGPVNCKADTALGYINKIAAVGVSNTSVFTAPTTGTATAA